VQDLLFDALSDHTRRLVLELLAKRGPQRAGEISDALKVPPPAMSRHLKVLLTAGLVADERVKDDARMRFFKLEPEGIAAAQAYLDQLQMEWRTQLKSFKRHVEDKQR
jgi:DNA-binding transcriptional ArsR family regulator